jgi:hypothetical protein
VAAGRGGSLRFRYLLRWPWTVAGVDPSLLSASPYPLFGFGSLTYGPRQATLLHERARPPRAEDVPPQLVAKLTAVGRGPGCCSGAGGVSSPAGGTSSACASGAAGSAVAAASTREASAGSAATAAAPRGPWLSRPRLGRRQGVPAAPLDQLPEHREAHNRELDVVPGVPAGEGRHDCGLGSGHAVAEQRQDVGRDPLDRGVEVDRVGGARQRSARRSLRTAKRRNRASQAE